MPSALRRLRATSPALLLLPASLAVWIALLGMVVTREGMAEDDGPVLGWLVGHRSASWTTAMTAISSTPAVAVLTAAVVAVTIAVAVAARSVRPIVTVVLALGAAGVAGEVLKSLIARARPPVTAMLGVPETGYGFPSNHTLATTALVGALVVVVWQATPRRAARAGVTAAAVLVALGMGASRLYLGDHWLTDVLASYALAVAVLAAVGWITGRYWVRFDRWAAPALRRLPPPRPTR